MIQIPAEVDAILRSSTINRPKLRALLGEALTEAEFVAIKRHYLRLRREAGGAPRGREGQRRRRR